MNEMLTSLEHYRATTATQLLILGVKKGADLYACYTDLKNSAFIASLKSDRDSTKKGGRKKWRFRPNNKQRETLLESCWKVEKIGTLEDLEKMKGNKGEAFESLIRGYEEKDNIPYTQAGDYTDENGREWQIKFENATVFYQA